MLNYLIRRLLFTIPVLLAVMFVTFVLFFILNDPHTIAKKTLGPKATEPAIVNWLHQRGYDKPRFINRTPGAAWHDSLFINYVKAMATFDFGTSDVNQEPIAARFARGAFPSLCITLPGFILGFIVAIFASIFLVMVRDSKMDTAGTVLCVFAMSVPGMVYVIAGHFLGTVILRWFPSYGFAQGPDAVRSVALPVFLFVMMGIGGDVRMYRAIFLEVARADFIRTARAKGVGLWRIMGVHIFKNGLITLITLVVTSLPFLILGTLLLEDFFGIPGLGGITFEAIRSSDFSVLRAVVYISSLMYMFGLLLTDILYALADPRIRLK